MGLEVLWWVQDKWFEVGITEVELRMNLMEFRLLWWASDYFCRLANTVVGRE